MNPLNRAITRACTDAGYRARLLADARQGLAEAGIDVPDDIDVRVHESKPVTVLIVLPAAKGLDLGHSTRRTPCGPVADVPEGLELEIDNYRFAELPRIVDNEGDMFRFLQGFRWSAGDWDMESAVLWSRATKTFVGRWKRSVADKPCRRSLSTISTLADSTISI